MAYSAIFVMIMSAFIIEPFVSSQIVLEKKTDSKCKY